MGNTDKSNFDGNVSALNHANIYSEMKGADHLYGGLLSLRGDSLVDKIRELM